MKREPLVELQREDEQALLLGEPSRQSLFVVERQEQEGAMVSCYALRRSCRGTSAQVPRYRPGGRYASASLLLPAR